MFKKSTSFMRPRVTVLEPHSMSAWPLEIAEKRVCTVTGTHSILMSDTPNCCAIDSVTSWHSSREKPGRLAVFVFERKWRCVGAVGDPDSFVIDDRLQATV